LKCLGINNSKHFSEITKISDALERMNSLLQNFCVLMFLSVQKKIQIDKKAIEFDPDEHMEFEDNDGNVVSKKTYELMKKQGLIQ